MKRNDCFWYFDFVVFIEFIICSMKTNDTSNVCGLFLGFRIIINLLPLTTYLQQIKNEIVLFRIVWLFSTPPPPPKFKYSTAS